MKTMTRMAVAALAACVACAAWAAEKPATEGAEVGKWTMDAEAAKAKAKETGKPVLMNFTGSDWCYWCKLMDEKVFTQKAWQDFAAKELVLLWVDFPRDKSLVPESIAAANKKLQAEYGVTGYPTFVLLDPEGKEIGRLRASAEATPEWFIGQVQDVLLAKDLKTLLSAEDYAAYEAANKELADLNAKRVQLTQQLMQEVSALQQRYAAEKAPIDEKYKDLKDDPQGKQEYDAAVKALDTKYQPEGKKLEDKYNPLFRPLGQQLDATTKKIEALKAKAREAAAKKA